MIPIGHSCFVYATGSYGRLILGIRYSFLTSVADSSSSPVQRSYAVTRFKERNVMTLRELQASQSAHVALSNWRCCRDSIVVQRRRRSSYPLVWDLAPLAD